MRPRGEVRAALSAAMEAFVAERGPVVLATGVVSTELAQRAQVAFALADRTLDNMARSGELRILRVAPAPGVNRGRRAYAPADDHGATMAQLEDLLRTWSRHRH